MRKVIFLSLLIVAVTLSAFIIRDNGDDFVFIPSSKQRTGDAGKGYDYLVNGDYIQSGIPYSIYLFGAGADKNNYLKRGHQQKYLT